MNVVLVVARSLDGYINHLGQRHASDWTSSEDKQVFVNLLKQCKLRIMGYNTYTDNADNMNFDRGIMRIVFSRKKPYSNKAKSLLFTDRSIPEVVGELGAAGHEQALLLGGGQMYQQFLELGLVGEVFETVEPLKFGDGIDFLPNGKSLLDYKYLKLVDSQKLNNTGTVLNHYKKF